MKNENTEMNKTDLPAKYDRDMTRHTKIQLFEALHILMTVALFFVFWMLFRYGRVYFSVTREFRYNYYIPALFTCLYLFFCRTYNAYLLGYSRIRELVWAQFISQMLAVWLTYFAVTVSWLKLNNPLWLVVLLAVYAMLDTCWSYYANGFYYCMNPTRSTILLYKTENDLKRVLGTQGKATDRLYEIKQKYCCTDEEFQQIKAVIEEYDAVIVAGLDSHCRNGIAKYCLETGKHGFFLPHVGDIVLQGAEHIHSFSSPVLYTSRKTPAAPYLFTKRAFDIIASGCGIILFSPLMLITALVIRLYDGGPAIYKQTRLTKDGKKFLLYKFRSMRVDAERDGRARLSSGDLDERTTPIGRFIRKCRMDELPQLFNILKGDMTFVGPRPERPEIAEEYYNTLPDFRLRLQVKAGLTGYAQVYGKYNTEPYEKLEFDLLYINRMSLLTDLRLMFATFGILFKAESTEGVEKEMMIPGDGK